MLKTSGVADALREVLEPRKDQIILAARFGSVAKGPDNASSDSDVLIIGGALTLEDVDAVFDPARDCRDGRSPSVGEFN